MNKAEKIKRTPADIEAAMQEVEEKSRLFTEAHKDDNSLGISRYGNSHIEVSEDLKEAAHLYVDTTIECFDSEGNSCCYPAFIAGAQWQKEQMVEDACKWFELHDSYAVPTNIMVRDLKEHLSSK